MHTNVRINGKGLSLNYLQENKWLTKEYKIVILWRLNPSIEYISIFCLHDSCVDSLIIQYRMDGHDTEQCIRGELCLRQLFQCLLSRVTAII